MAAVAFANRINFGIIVFSLGSIILYSAAAIQNAKKDGDYDLPDYADKAVIFIIIISFMVASLNKLAFIGLIGELVFGIVYNFYSRKILFGDVTILALSHYGWPTFISGLLLDLEFMFCFKLSVFMFIMLWFTMHIKNLKDTKEDRKRGYKTLSTEFNNASIICAVFMSISLIIFLTGYFFFHGDSLYLIGLMVLSMVAFFISLNLIDGKKERALDLLRFYYVLVSLIFVIDRADSISVYLMEMIILSTYIRYLYKTTFSLSLGKLSGRNEEWKNTMS